MTPPRNPEPPAHAELTALADGSLGGSRRERLEAQVARSPELAALLEQQRKAVGAMRSVAVRAPEGLRARVEAERGGARRTGRASATAPRTSRGRRLRLGLALAGATAAVALVVALALPGAPGGPSVVEAAELGARPATQPAPGPGGPKLLAASAQGLPFPDWRERFGWRATGERQDEIEGRDAVTVFYAKEGRRIAYTIVSGEALDPPPRSARARREGTRLRYVRADDGRLIVTWRRSGRTCILTGSGVPAGSMLDLAGWRGLGAVPF
jgi:hypothetical protein